MEFCIPQCHSYCLFSLPNCGICGCDVAGRAAGFREEDDASTLTVPFSATWQQHKVAAFL